MSAAALRSAHDAARALRADNRSLRAENAALRAELAALRAAPAAGGPPAAPASAGASNPVEGPVPAAGAPADLTVRTSPIGRKARAAPAALCLPVEVWVRVCAFLDDPLDVFSLARTCHAAHTASCSRGAWLEVDLDGLAYARLRRPHKTVVLDLTDEAGHKATPDAWAASMAAANFTMFFVAHPAAASGITRLALPPANDCCLKPVAVMLRHCASVKRLLNLNRWRHANALALLRVAADAGLPVEHVHLNVLVPETVPLLLRLPALSSLYYSHHFHGAVGHLEPPLDVALLETLVKRLRLTRLELDVTVGPLTPMPVESATLKELHWGGKNLIPGQLLCPALTTFTVDGFLCHQVSPEERQRLLAGCPQLRAVDMQPWNYK